MKRIKGLTKLLIGILAIVFLLLGAMTLLEYDPAQVEEIAIGEEKKELDKKEFSVLSYNIGYGGLGKDADFFMDGGTSVNPPSKEVVENNLSGIMKELKKHPADFYLLQEVDLPSKRSFRINQKEVLEEGLGLKGYFAANYKAFYVPFPWPPIGKIHSGLLSLSEYGAERVYRESLPVPFSWPISTVNLKRCLLVQEFPIAGSNKKLILMNLHLEAYDKGEGKRLQSQTLLNLAEQYYADGHYVLAGGDWNQRFPGSEAYTIQNKEYWTPGNLDPSELPKGWSYVADPSSPSCRSLHAAYLGEGHQVYLIDGFLLSPNLSLKKIETLNLGFIHSDHHPVRIELRFVD